jgi:magnesium transporter
VAEERGEEAEAQHPADIAASFEQMGAEEARRAFASLDGGTAARVVEFVSPELAEVLLQDLDVAEAADLLQEVAPDDAADVLGHMPTEAAESVLAEMEEPERTELGHLLAYPEDVAGAIMTTEVTPILESLSAQEAIEFIRARAGPREAVYYAYVVNAEGRLAGVVSFRDLVFAQPDSGVMELTNRDVASVHVNDDKELVAALIQKYDLLALPVLDDGHRLVGVVTVDDVLDVMQDEFTEDVQKMGGIAEGDEGIDTSVPSAMRKRAPWMLLILVLYLMVPLGIAPFQGIIAQVAILAVFMPVISAIGGNVGSQALAVTIRALAVGEEANLRTFWRVARKEVLLGLLNGLALGVALGLISYLWKGNYFLGIIIAVGLWANVLIASLLGGIFPVLLKRFGRDPAMMTGPIVTMVMDFFGFVLFLSICARFLDYLR